MSDVDLVVVDGPAETSATCLVCGQPISPGAGVTARYGDKILRFKCPGCLSRFRIDPERYLSGGPSSCCDDEHEHATHEAPDAVVNAFGGTRPPRRVVN